MLKKISYILLFLLISINLYSQNFNYKADVAPVDKEGYYKIFLHPEITSHLNHSFPDIRLEDNKNNEVQYITKQKKTIYNKGKRIHLKILKNKYKKFKHYTEIIAENTKNEEISNFIFKVVNSHNPVFIKVSGSTDKLKWYVLKNNYPVFPDISNEDTILIKVMNIPRSDFKYFKILFHDYDENKINVTDVYYYKLSDIRSEYTQLPKPKVTQKDTMNKTILTIEFPEPQFIDMLTFGIKGPEFYLRKAKMIKEDSVSEVSPGEEFYDQMKKDIWFGSLKSNRIILSDYKAGKIKFIIDNKDNLPLKFYKVNGYQLKNYLVAYLLPETEYHILYGNKEAGFPNYDLPYFVDTIPSVLPETYAYNIRKNLTEKKKITKLWNFPLQYLWVIIGGVAVILLIISILMLKQISRNKNEK